MPPLRQAKTLDRLRPQLPQLVFFRVSNIPTRVFYFCVMVLHHSLIGLITILRSVNIMVLLSDGIRDYIST